jgi:hypothetical protein
VREPAEFIVDASEVRRGTPLGKCTASLHGEKADVPVKMSALRNQVFKARILITFRNEKIHTY